MSASGTLKLYSLCTHSRVASFPMKMEPGKDFSSQRKAVQTSPGILRTRKSLLLTELAYNLARCENRRESSGKGNVESRLLDSTLERGGRRNRCVHTSQNMRCRGLRLLSALSLVALLCCVSPGQTSLTEMDKALWTQHVKAQPAPDMLVLLYKENSQESQVAEQVVEAMMKEGEIEQVLPGIQVMKQKEGGPLSGGLGIKTFPAVVLIRDDIAAYYTGSLEESSELFMWLDKAGTKALSKELTDSTFEHLTQASTGSTTGHWLVLFYRSECLDHFPVLESVGISEKLWMNVARVNLDNNPRLEKRFKVTSCPEMIYFREGKMYRYETKKYDLPSLTSFITSWFRNVKATPVPISPTAFDELTEGIAMFIKTQLEGENRTFTLIVVAGFAVTMAITSVFCCLTGGSDSKQKTE